MPTWQKPAQYKTTCPGCHRNVQRKEVYCLVEWLVWEHMQSLLTWGTNLHASCRKGNRSERWRDTGSCDLLWGPRCSFPGPNTEFWWHEQLNIPIRHKALLFKKFHLHISTFLNAHVVYPSKAWLQPAYNWRDPSPKCGRVENVILNVREGEHLYGPKTFERKWDWARKWIYILCTLTSFFHELCHQTILGPFIQSNTDIHLLE